MPSNVLPLQLKQTFLPMICIFTEGEGVVIESKLPFKIFLIYKLSQKSTDLMDPPIAYCFTFCEYRYFFATLYTANDYDEQKHDNVIEACSRRRRVLAIWVV